MSDLLPFVVVGITTGSVYGMAAVGLVLTYKTSGIFNFAHGAMAAVAAYAFYELNAIRGLPWPVALVVSVVVLPPLLALIMERIARVLARGTPTAKIVATVGLQLGITSALIAHYGAEALPFPTFLPTSTFTVIGVNVGVDQVVSLLVAAIGVAALFVMFRVTRLGVQMRAVVDDPDLLELAGTSAFKVRTWAWLIGAWFAAGSGVLLAPYVSLDALLLTLLVVQSFGAAAVGFFSSLPLTYAGGILIGVLSSVSTDLVPGSSVLRGLPASIPFLVLFAVLLLVPRRRLVEVTGKSTGRGTDQQQGTRSHGRLIAVVALAACALVPLVVGPKLPVYANALVFFLIFQSLHLLVRTSGQISLSHAGFVAVGASTFAHLVGGGVPWLLAVALAGLVTVPVGMVVAIPAIRFSGLFLALATFGFGLLLEKIAYRSTWMFGSTGNLAAPRPTGFESDTAYFYVLLAFAALVAMAMALIGRSRLGRLLRALADSPVTLTTLGLSVNVTRVTAFAISAFVAGVAGALFAGQSTSATAESFTAMLSLTWLAVLYLNSTMGRAAPAAAAIGLAVVPGYITSVTVTEWLPVLFGIGAVVVAMHESTQRHRRAATAEPTDAAAAVPTLSRAALRVSGVSPVREGIRTAVRNRRGPATARVVVTARLGQVGEP